MDSRSQEENISLDSWLNGKKVLIISGERNSGKSTKLERIITGLLKRGKNVKGVISKGYFSGKIKSNYDAVYISNGKVYQLASITESKKFNLKQGKYFFDEKVFDEINKLLKDDMICDVNVFDEISYLELNEKGFYPSLKHYLDNFEGQLIISIRNNLLQEVINKFQITADSVILKI